MNHREAVWQRGVVGEPTASSSLSLPSATTRAVAREAAEAEFHQKTKKRRRGGGGGGGRRRGRKGGRDDEDYDDDDDDDDDDENDYEKHENDDDASDGEGHRRKRERGKKHTSAQVVVTSAADATSEAGGPIYRDRAKERREGKQFQPEEEDAQQSKGSNKESEDETDSDGDLEDALWRGQSSVNSSGPAVTKHTVEPAGGPHYAQSESEALEQLATLQPRCPLGHELLPFLRQRVAVIALLKNDPTTQGGGGAVTTNASLFPTPAGIAVQHTTLTFATQANPLDWARAWQCPLERTLVAGVASSSTEATGRIPKASPLGEGLLKRIDAALRRRFVREQERAAATRSAVAASFHRDGRDEEEEEDDDDHIFANAGSSDLENDDENENENETGKAKTNLPGAAEDRPAEPGGAAADDNGNPSSSSGAPPSHPTPRVRRFDARPEIGVDSGVAIVSTLGNQTVREAAVGNGVDHAMNSAAAPKQRLAGLSAVAGYGDYLDTDFTGRFDDEDDKKKNKKAKKKRKTKAGNNSDSD